MTNYTVVMDAVTIATGKRDPQTHAAEVVRLMKGDPIEAPEDHPSILTLLSTKAIRPTEDYTGSEHVTTRHVFRLYHDAASGDLVEGAVPIAAPLPITDPNEL